MISAPGTSVRIELGLTEAVQRQGPLDATKGERSPIHLYSMRETESRGLGWLGDDLRAAISEVVLTEVTTGGDVEWTWVRNILDARPSDRLFTLDDGTWREIIHFDRIGTTITHEDYAVGTGFTVRFGDGKFGRIPELNADEGNTFRVTYRIGGGARANVARDTIVALADATGSGRNMPDFVQAGCRCSWLPIRWGPSSCCPSGAPSSRTRSIGCARPGAR